MLELICSLNGKIIAEKTFSVGKTRKYVSLPVMFTKADSAQVKIKIKGLCTNCSELYVDEVNLNRADGCSLTNITDGGSTAVTYGEHRMTTTSYNSEGKPLSEDAYDIYTDTHYIRQYSYEYTVAGKLSTVTVREKKGITAVSTRVYTYNTANGVLTSVETKTKNESMREETTGDNLGYIVGRVAEGQKYYYKYGVVNKNYRLIEARQCVEETAGNHSGHSGEYVEKYSYDDADRMIKGDNGSLLQKRGI